MTRVKGGMILWGSAVSTAALLVAAGWFGHSGSYGVAATLGLIGLVGILVYGAITIMVCD